MPTGAGVWSRPSDTTGRSATPGSSTWRNRCAKPGMTEIPCPLEAAAKRCGDRPVSYREFRHLVATAAAAFRQAGCNPADRIGVPAPNSPDYLVWLLAAMRIGAVCCPMSTRLPSRTVADQLRDIDCRTLVVDDPEIEGLGDAVTLRGRVLRVAGHGGGYVQGRPGAIPPSGSEEAARNVCAMTAAMPGPGENDLALDPACGTGGFPIDGATPIAGFRDG